MSLSLSKGGDRLRLSEMIRFLKNIGFINTEGTSENLTEKSTLAQYILAHIVSPKIDN